MNAGKARQPTWVINADAARRLKEFDPQAVVIDAGEGQYTYHPKASQEANRERVVQGLQAVVLVPVGFVAKLVGGEAGRRFNETIWGAVEALPKDIKDIEMHGAAADLRMYPAGVTGKDVIHW